MVPFDRSHTTSYQSAIVSITPSCTIFENLTLKNIVTLKSRSGVTHAANLCTTSKFFTSPNSTDPELSVLWQTLWVYLHSSVYAASLGKAYDGRSRSFNVTWIGTNLKPICDFLLVFSCNYMPIFYRYRDMTISWRKSVFLPFLPTTFSFEALARGFP